MSVRNRYVLPGSRVSLHSAYNYLFVSTLAKGVERRQGGSGDVFAGGLAASTAFWPLLVWEMGLLGDVSFAPGGGGGRSWER